METRGSEEITCAILLFEKLYELLFIRYSFSNILMHVLFNCSFQNMPVRSASVNYYAADVHQLFYNSS